MASWHGTASFTWRRGISTPCFRGLRHTQSTARRSCSPADQSRERRSGRTRGSVSTTRAARRRSTSGCSPTAGSRCGCSCRRIPTAAGTRYGWQRSTRRACLEDRQTGSISGVIGTMSESGRGIKVESWLVSAGRDPEPGAPLNVPLVPASNFILGGGRGYARDDGTRTWEALEAVVGALESGQAVAFASGMAAVASVFDQLGTGAAVALPDDCYQ